MKDQNKIECPNCGTEINVSEVLYAQVKNELNSEFQEQKKKWQEKNEEFESRRKEFEKEKEAFSNKLQDAVEEKLKEDRKELEKSLRNEIEDEQSEQLKTLEEELNEKSKKLKEFNKAQAEIQKLKREKEELKSDIEAKAEKRISEALRKERAKVKKQEEENYELKMKEKEELIKKLKENLKEAQRRAEQGSVQSQGEVQELAIEEYLNHEFPLDSIDEIKKGAYGADVLHTVNTRAHQNCGTIYYESKRTKHFGNDWISKFKSDILDKGADIGVLVTEAMPEELDRMGLIDGVWVCTFPEFKGLCHVLRDSLIKLSNVMATQENKGEKMTMLYDYLTSQEFKMQIESIVEGFTQMQEDLEREKRSMHSHWKRREKQIEKVIMNTNHMYSSIKGIAGNAIPNVKSLEMEEPEELPDGKERESNT